jgi:protein HIRA/HIR1
MVVAEIPLWVVHSDNATNNNVPASNPTNSHPDETTHKAQRAKESLALLEGLGGTQKCAIYSVDVHPNGNKFATAGGDGKVRIWNAGALFPTKSSRPAKYVAGGNYESSGESSTAEDSIESASGEKISASSEGEEDNLIHDLSNVVRRKKDGSTPTKQSASPTKTSINNLVPVQHHNQPKNGASHHRLLCTLSAHTGSSVLAVRFSTNGQYLASAGDDAVICIYTKANAHGNLENTHHSVEHWTRIKLCRGHALDAVGLAWAPDDSHLVSCSLDSNTPIIVWKLNDLASNEHKPTQSNVLCNPYKILGKGLHTSTVKGVTFDPAGTYLASSGDDPSICIWRAHDDWGLEKRIDAGSGIFRRWKENDAQTLSSQSLFRRLSWSTDGAYICSTNAVVKNKHVASTISREGWAVSNSKSTASGAANLVGHKQPVVVSRHCPILLDARPEGVEGDDEDPEYGNLLALGDKRGFVTVWSTRRSRPVFKIQCSESRCTVTDLAWGKVENDLMLIVSLLDGQVAVLRFGVPDELGKVLKAREQARVFQMRYGIDLNDVTDMGRRRLFVGENSGPKLIENALQFSLEDNDDGNEDENEPMDHDNPVEGKQTSIKNLSANEVKTTQAVSRSKGGKKRIQPLLMVGNGPSPKKAKMANGDKSSDKAAKKKAETLEDAMEMAEKAASGAEAAAATQHTSIANNRTRADSSGDTSHNGHHREMISKNAQQQQLHQAQLAQRFQAASTPQIPHSTSRIHSVDLPGVNGSVLGGENGGKFVADCTNSIQIPQGSSGSALPCTVLSISSAGRTMWCDQLPGTSCSTITASKNLLALGTSDGCVQLYGTSPSVGWTSGIAFRSHPPLVFGRPIVTLQIHDVTPTQTEMLIVTADGSFGVYSVFPELKVQYKGTIMPPMTHMLLSSDMSTETYLPRLARLQLTDTNRLLLLLSLHSLQGNAIGEEKIGGGKKPPSVGAGGSLQAFVYSETSELWMRVADSRFVLSDFYSTLPLLSKLKKGRGELSKLDDAVRMGSTSGTLKAVRRGRSYGHADAAYNQARDESSNDIATRSHCEDRMACALALGSASEFEYWLSMYVRSLTMCGYESLLRILVDMLLGKISNGDMTDGQAPETLCWWLSDATHILTCGRIKLITTIVIPEMSKNRALQRITNEIAVEVESLKP